MGKKQLAEGGDGKMKVDFQCFDISAFSSEIFLESFKIRIYVKKKFFKENMCIYTYVFMYVYCGGGRGERERLLMKNSHFCYAQFLLFMIVMSSKVAMNQ